MGIMILHVRAEPAEECVTRAIERAKTEGRAVPEEQVRESVTASERSVKELAKEADFVIRIVNRTGQTPELQPISESEGDGINPSPKKLEQGGGWRLLRACFKPLKKSRNSEGSTFLRKDTLEDAMKSGVLTPRVVDSIDTSLDGEISSSELAMARRLALAWGEIEDQNLPFESSDSEEQPE